MLNKIALLAALILQLAVGSANATTIYVYWNGSTIGDDSTGGPYTISGGFTFDTEVPGATSNLASVSIVDPGISAFNLSFTGSYYSQSFTNNTAIADAIAGSFDLSNAGVFDDIIVATTCIEGTGGNATCDVENPAGVAEFFLNGQIFFSPAGTGGLEQSFNLSYRVSGGTSVVPIPAALPLLASGIGALGFAGWRRNKKNKLAA